MKKENLQKNFQLMLINDYYIKPILKPMFYKIVDVINKNNKNVIKDNEYNKKDIVINQFFDLNVENLANEKFDADVEFKNGKIVYCLIKIKQDQNSSFYEKNTKINFVQILLNNNEEIIKILVVYKNNEQKGYCYYMFNENNECILIERFLAGTNINERVFIN